MDNDREHPTLSAGLAAIRDLHKWTTAAEALLTVTAKAVRDLTHDQRRTLAGDYPQLMDALLLVEDGYRESGE